jgi:hypothetical protein
VDGVRPFRFRFEPALAHAVAEHRRAARELAAAHAEAARTEAALDALAIEAAAARERASRTHWPLADLDRWSAVHGRNVRAARAAHARALAAVSACAAAHDAARRRKTGFERSRERAHAAYAAEAELADERELDEANAARSCAALVP